MKRVYFIQGIVLGLIFLLAMTRGVGAEDRLPQPLLPMESLKNVLTYARGAGQGPGIWPRTINYEFEAYDFKTETFLRESKAFTLKHKPCRIIPHAVGVAEILWAICPRDRLIAFNEYAADPEFCFLADVIRKRGPIFQTKQTELVIGYQPDLVFTVFYSDAAFKEKLTQAKIPYFDLGYFGTIESIEKQALLIGEIIGEENNARALVRVMNEKIKTLQGTLPKLPKPVRVMYYDEGGYIPGKSSNFNSICEMIKVVNVGAEQGIKSWSQSHNETLLKWNPDVIIVPQESHLKEQLLGSQMLSHAQAIKNGKVFYVPGVYLRVDSQFMILSANLLAGIVYGKTP